LGPALSACREFASAGQFDFERSALEQVCKKIRQEFCQRIRYPQPFRLKAKLEGCSVNLAADASRAHSPPDRLSRICNFMERFRSTGVSPSAKL
jgi:hypothetical protein